MWGSLQPGSSGTSAVSFEDALASCFLKVSAQGLTGLAGEETRQVGLSGTPPAADDCSCLFPEVALLVELCSARSVLSQRARLRDSSVGNSTIASRTSPGEQKRSGRGQQKVQEQVRGYIVEPRNAILFVSQSHVLIVIARIRSRFARNERAAPGAKRTFCFGKMMTNSVSGCPQQALAPLQTEEVAGCSEHR